MTLHELTATARAMVAPGKGILAADESVATCSKRLAALGIDTSETSRRDYREMLLTTPKLSETISGVILFDETFHQTLSDGTPFPDYLDSQGIMPGIKVDTGAMDLALSPGEKVTEGLDGLRPRLTAYREGGARFAKWRAVITIGPGIPTQRCVVANAHALARYSALCQEAGIVPIVEPEVLMDGDHSIERCEEVTEHTLRTVFAQLSEQAVVLEGMILKASMVISGKGCPAQAGVEEVAAATLRCLRRTVPPAVPGVAFLSGGQSADLASAHLSAMNRSGPHPWELSFSYGRALQDPALAAWAGDPAKKEAGQDALAHRARCNSAARSGSYTAEMESAA